MFVHHCALQLHVFVTAEGVKLFCYSCDGCFVGLAAENDFLNGYFTDSLPSEQSLPQRGLAWGFHSLHFAQVLLVAPAVVNHFVDDAPVVQAAYVAVVDVEVGVELAAVAVGWGLLALGKVTVHCVELEAALAAKVYGLLQQVAFANAPQDESVALGL